MNCGGLWNQATVRRRVSNGKIKFLSFAFKKHCNRKSKYLTFAVARFIEMHVWLVNHYALPPSEPGGTRHYALARYLVRRGHEVTIIAASFNHATGKQRSCAAGKLCTFEEFEGVPFLWPTCSWLSQQRDPALEHAGVRF